MLVTTRRLRSNALYRVRRHLPTTCAPDDISYAAAAAATGGRGVLNARGLCVRTTYILPCPPTGSSLVLRHGLFVTFVRYVRFQTENVFGAVVCTRCDMVRVKLSVFVFGNKKNLNPTTI